MANEGLVRDSSGFRILKMVHNPGGDDGILGIWDNPSYLSCLLETDLETSDAGNIYSFHGKHGGGRFPRSEQQGSLEMLKPWMYTYINIQTLVDQHQNTSLNYLFGFDPREIQHISQSV